jgi:hypothetical protein
MRHPKRWLLVISSSLLLAAAIYIFGPHVLYPERYARRVFDQVELPERTALLAEGGISYRNQKTMPGLRCSGQALRLGRTYVSDLPPDALLRFYYDSWRTRGWRTSTYPPENNDLRSWRSLATLLTPNSGISLHLSFMQDEALAHPANRAYRQYAEQGRFIYFIVLQYTPVSFYCSD